MKEESAIFEGNIIGGSVLQEWRVLDMMTQTLFLTDEQRAIKPLFDLKKYFG